MQKRRSNFEVEREREREREREKEREREREGGGRDKLGLREIPQFVNFKGGTRKNLVFPNWTGRNAQRC